VVSEPILITAEALPIDTPAPVVAEVVHAPAEPVQEAQPSPEAAPQAEEPAPVAIPQPAEEPAPAVAAEAPAQPAAEIPVEPVLPIEAVSAPAPQADAPAAQPEPAAVQAQAEVPAPVAEPPAPQPASILDTPAQIVVPQAASHDELVRVVEQAGMQWVETDSDKLAASRQAAPAAAPARLGREPRIRAQVTSEALVQVETRSDLRH